MVHTFKLNSDSSWRSRPVGTPEPPRISPVPWQAGQWVQLLELPSPFSFHEALLLCQCGPNQWFGWVPDYGEILLHERQFYRS